MIRLHYSNRLENLVAPLAHAIAGHQQRAPLEPVTIVVPNRVVEQFVRHRVAEEIGVAANLQFPFLRSYLKKILGAADPALSILDADELQIVLFECLRSKEHRANRDFEPVRAYIEAGSKSEADLELRTLLLAGHAARLFREYSISRRAMVLRWGSAAAAKSEAERWQRHLWRCVFSADGSLLPRWIDGASTKWKMIPDAFDALSPAARNSAVRGTLHVFGHSYMGAAFAQIFAKLAEHADIRIYTLNPCLEFWEDVQDGRQIARDAWIHRRAKLPPPAGEQGEDPFNLYSSLDPAALRLWGRPGREHIRLLNEITDCDFEPHFSEPGPDGAGSLLGILQDDILCRRPPLTVARNDGSIRFLACPGIRREVEIVADEIHALIRDNDALAAAGKAEPLRYHQIALLIPDASYEEYAPHIESVLREQRGIAVETVNRRFAGISRVAEAIDLLMRLPLGRLTRGEMLRLLTHRAILAGAAGDDPELWRVWVERLGVFFGADSGDLGATYANADLFHWDQALKRLALGSFMAGEASGIETTFDAPGSHRYLPFEVQQDSIDSVARMVRVARGLISDALETRDARMTLAEWSRLLGELVGTYIVASSATDERIRDHYLAEIDRMGSCGVPAGEVGFGAAYELARARVAEIETSAGGLAGSGVAVGTFTALRSIPFRAVFVLGLGEGELPSRNPGDPLDLRLERRLPGDVSPTERDRYMLLETLLAARERICFSYVARDSQTGDRLEPSTLLSELQFILRGYVADEARPAMTVHHRVSRYDLAYFPQLPEANDDDRAAGLQSFDTDARRGARMVALRRNLARKLGGSVPCGRDELMRALSPAMRERIRADLQMPDLSPGDSRDPGARCELWLPLTALRKFLECPMQATARYALGMFQEGDPLDESGDEPLEQTTLQRAILLRGVFWETGGDTSLTEQKYESALALAQMKGEAPAGMLADAASQDDIREINGWISSATSHEIDDLADWLNVRIGRADEFFSANRLFPPIPLDATVTAPDGSSSTRRVMLHGTVQGISPQLDASIQCKTGNNPGPRNFLPLFLNAVALAAAGAKVGSAFRAIVIGGKGDGWSARTVAPIARDEACAYLAKLAGHLLSCEGSYFLPLEAIEKVVNARNATGPDALEALEKLRAHEKPAYCSSDNGPIRPHVAHSFQPPPPDQMKAMIRERYGPVMGIFDAPAPAKGKLRK